MKDLIARLKAAEVGSKELDCEIGLIARTDGKGEVSNHFGAPCIRDAGGPYAPQPYTTSLDAALALAERVLPGWGWCVARDAGASETARFRAWVQSEEDRQANPLGLSSSAAASAALALCISTLRAKESQA